MFDSTALTLESLKFHCRTCLIKLHDDDEKGQVLETEMNVHTETRGRMYKDLTSNMNLQKLIEINIDAAMVKAQGVGRQMEQYTHICMHCWKMLEDFERFRLQAVKSAVILCSIFQRAVVKDPTSTEASVQPSVKQPHAHRITRTSRRSKKAKQQKDVLQDIESVTLLDAANLIEVPKYDISTRDPFYGDAKLQLKSEAKEQASVTDTESDAEHNTATTQSTQTSVRVKRRKCATKSMDHAAYKRHKGAAYRCMKCEKRFVHKLYYEAHMLQVHEGATLPYVCDQCGKAYKGVTSLKYHKYVAHVLGTKTFPCSECGHEYRTEVSLKRHHLSVHLGQKPTKRLVCEQCGATFLNSRALLIHNKAKHVMVNGEQSGSEFKCTHCGKVFQSPYTLNYHVLRDHLQQKDYACTNCGVGFAKKFMLVAHMRSHAPDAEKFPCDQCERRFNSKADRQKHVRVVHLKLKPHVCADCGDAFGSPKTLRHHVYIHTGEKPYVCDICGHGFRQLTAMKTHRNTHAKKSNTAVS